MRISRFLLGAVALFAVAASAPAQADGFLSAYEDLPLAPGLTEVAGSGLSFDTPHGRIVEAYAKGAGESGAVFRFYATTLPQLGWTRETDSRYRREAEVLHLDSAPDGAGVVVHFTISPD